MSTETVSRTWWLVKSNPTLSPSIGHWATPPIASIPSAPSPLTWRMGEEHTDMTFSGPAFQSSDCKPQGNFLGTSKWTTWSMGWLDAVSTALLSLFQCYHCHSSNGKPLHKGANTHRWFVCLLIAHLQYHQLSKYKPPNCSLARFLHTWGLHPVVVVWVHTHFIPLVVEGKLTGVNSP